jgi:Resolvase, N terminal domain
MADPDELTPAERIDATRQAARSLMRLLEAIERGELAATPVEIARLQGAVEALGAIAGELQAAGLLVAKMDRLSRSVVDGAGLMERAAREGWALHFADLDIDTSTPAGEMAANIIISGSQYERRLISQRTRDALAAKRARGERLGAAPALPLEVTRRILAERANGRTFQAIADGLMADGILTARGNARWFPATIKAVTASDNAAQLALAEPRRIKSDLPGADVIGGGTVGLQRVRVGGLTSK